MPDFDVPRRPNVLFFSPAELFYKAELGYERQVSPNGSLGLVGTYRYGFDGRYAGWQASLYHRWFLTRKFPTGLYFQAHTSIFNFLQEEYLTPISNYRPFFVEYRALSGGGGAGLGYRSYLLRRFTNQHLMVNTMLGLRFQYRPAYEYDNTVYRRSVEFFGPGGDWLLGYSPGSFMHGQLSLNYCF